QKKVAGSWDQRDQRRLDTLSAGAPRANIKDVRKCPFSQQVTHSIGRRSAGVCFLPVQEKLFVFTFSDKSGRERSRGDVMPLLRWAPGIVCLIPLSASAQQTEWEKLPRMQLERQFAGPLQDTVIQRWRDPVDGTVCYVYLPITAPH